ncbi:MAG: hypothetical protein M3464_21065 [Chloroflexota bacterium]|nr:hypothetical protein [Chloroflexota bacterium]
MEYAANHQTLPVDRDALHGRVLWLGRHEWREPDSYDRERRFVDLMGEFDFVEENRTRLVSGDMLPNGELETIEEAALILSGESARTAWRLYFLAVTTNKKDDVDGDLYADEVNGLDWVPPYGFAAFTPSRVLMTLAGDPTSDGLIRLYRNASEWWTTAMAGFRIRRPGRPKVVVPSDLIRATYWEMRDDAAGTPDDHDPTQEDVCDRLTSLGHRISPKTLRKGLRSDGFTRWPPPRPSIPPQDAIV